MDIILNDDRRLTKSRVLSASEVLKVWRWLFALLRTILGSRKLLRNRILKILLYYPDKYTVCNIETLI